MNIDREDLITGIGTFISVILSAIMWFWNIAPLNYLFTFILGSLVTYFIQSRLQDRADKKKIIREIIEKIYGPLYVELQNIDKKLVNGFGTIYHSDDFGGKAKCDVWKEIKSYPEFFSIPRNLRDEINQIVTISERMNNSVDEIQRIIIPITFDVGNSILDPDFQNVQGIYLEYRSKRDTILFTTSLLNYVILDNDPIEDFKMRFQHFTFNFLYIIITIGAHNISVPFSDKREEIYKIIEISKERMKRENEVSMFLNDRSLLSQKINEVRPIIERYIDKNYPIMKL